jgi:opacity protein-like surface antigen
MYPPLKSSIFALTTLLVPFSASATEHNAYVQINAGAAFAESFTDGGSFCDNFFGCSTFSYKEKADPGYVAGAAIGYRFADWFRLEGEAMFQSNGLNKSALTANTGNFGRFSQSNILQGERERTTFLLNGYYDFKNNTAFTPYISGGIGGYHLQLNAKRGRRSGENDVDFAWQLGAGLNYKLDDRISFDLKYRNLSGTEADVVVPNDFFLNDRIEFHDVGDHQIVVGIRIGFY